MQKRIAGVIFLFKTSVPVTTTSTILVVRASRSIKKFSVLITDTENTLKKKKKNNNNNNNLPQL